jgi:hypothetical protein
MARFRLAAWQDFSLPHSLQTEFEAQPASNPMGTVDHFPGGKAAGA